MKRILILLLLISCSGKSGSFDSLFDSQEVALDFTNPSKIWEHYNRGQYIANTIGACGHCHNKKSAPNISSDPNSGIGAWKVGEIVKILKGLPGKNDKLLKKEVHTGMPWISDYDARSIAIYLLTSKPLKTKDKKKYKTSFFDVFYSRPNVKGYVLQQKENATASYGRYLALNVASCQSCHEEGLKKLKTKKWSKEDYLNYFNTGKTAKGKKINPALCPWPYYRLANVADLQAMALFLKSIK